VLVSSPGIVVRRGELMEVDVEVDTENRLRQVGVLFADLLEERGVKGAVACMVELFFKGEEGVRK